MRRFDFQHSLRLRIVAILSAVLALGAVLLGLAAWHSASTAAEEAYDRLLTGGTVQIAENVYVQGGVVSLDPPAAAIATLAAYDLVFYKVVDPRGVVVAGYEDLVSKATPEKARGGVVLENGRYQGHAVRIATVARRVEDAAGGEWATIVAAQTIEARRTLTRDLTLKALAVILAMSALALLATGYAVKLALKPLTRIEREIAARRPDDLRPIAAVPPVEISNLVHAIDDFMRRLSDRMAVMQRFIADAAHQIRTPLAALDAQVEILQATPPSRRKAQTVARIRERTSELGRLTGQLLDHAMVIHRADAAVLGEIDLNALAKTALSTFVPLSLPREVTVSFSPSDASPKLQGDAVSLREALGNLIDNAFAHGAATRLLVAVGADETTAWIEVADDGGGFAQDPAELARPFAKGAGSHGSGLGLAIAADVARAHGGELRFSREDGLTCIRMVLSERR